MAKRLHIFTPVWGSHFTDLFENALGRSLRWPRNQETIENCIWTICTDRESSMVKLSEIAHQVCPSAELRIQLQPRFTERNAPIGALKMQCLLKSILECLNEGSSMLMSTPDFIWADGSIQNMWDETYPDEGQALCVSIAHMRVLPEMLREINEVECEPADLLYLGLEHAHESWRRCGEDLDPNGIYHSGLSWRQIPDSTTVTVQHQMPSPFLVNFVESDLEEFTRWKGVTPPAFGEWDHNWPSKLLKEGRLRHIGSSDVAFMVEVTEADKNVPPLEPARRPHDQFFRSEDHVRVHKQFISTFRY